MLRLSPVAKILWRRLGKRARRAVAIAGFAFGLTSIAAVGGLTVDGTGMYVTRMECQNAADAAALAAARGMCKGAGVIASMGKLLAARNGVSGTDTIVEWPVKGNSDLVRVETKKAYQFAFLSVLGFRSTDIRADATAEVTNRADSNFQSTLALFGRSEVDLLGVNLVDSYDSRLGTYESQQKNTDSTTGMKFGGDSADIRSDCYLTLRGANLLAGSAIAADGGPSPILNHDRDNQSGQHWDGTGTDEEEQNSCDEETLKRLRQRFEISESGAILSKVHGKVKVKVLGDALSNNEFGSIPLYLYYSLDDGDTWTQLNGTSDIDAGDVFTLSDVPVGAAIAFKVRGYDSYSTGSGWSRRTYTYDRTVYSNRKEAFEDESDWSWWDHSNDSTHFKQYVLKDEEPLPNKLNFYYSFLIPSYLRSYVNTSRRTANLSETEVLTLMEFSTSWSGADFDEVPLLVDFYELIDPQDIVCDETMQLLGKHTTQDGERAKKHAARMKARCAKSRNQSHTECKAEDELEELAGHCGIEGDDHKGRSTRLTGTQAFNENDHGDKMKSLCTKLRDCGNGIKGKTFKVCEEPTLRLKTTPTPTPTPTSTPSPTATPRVTPPLFIPGVRDSKCEQCGILEVRGAKNRITGDVTSDGPIILQDTPVVSGKSRPYFDTPEFWPRIKKPDWTAIGASNDNSRLAGLEGWNATTRDFSLRGGSDVTLPDGNFRINNLMLAGHSILRCTTRATLWVEGQVRISGLARLNPTENPDKLVIYMRTPENRRDQRKPCFSVMTTGAIQVDSPYAKVELKVLAKQLQNGAGGAHIPVYLECSKDGGLTWSPLFNSAAVTEGGTVTITGLQEKKQLVLRARALLKSGRTTLFDKMYQTNRRDSFSDDRAKYHQYTLRNGDVAPRIAAFSGQVPLGSYLGPYVDQSNGTMKLGAKDACYLLEFGSLYNSSGCDFQDLAVLATFTETDSAGTVVTDPTPPTPADHDCRIVAGGWGNSFVARGGSRVSALVFNEHGKIDIVGLAEVFGQLVSGAGVTLKGGARVHLDRGAARLLDPCAIGSRLIE